MSYQVLMNQKLSGGENDSSEDFGKMLASIKANKQDKLYRDAIKREMGMDVPEGAGEAAYLMYLKNTLTPTDPMEQEKLNLLREGMGLRREELGARNRGLDLSNDIDKQRIALDNAKLTASQVNSDTLAKQRQAQIDRAQQQQTQMQGIQQGGGFRPKSFTLGGINFERIPTEEEKQATIQEKVQEEQAKEARKGLPIETGGKLAMVKQAKNDIQEVRQMLFPDGTPQSFNRGRAFASNLPGSRAPIVGAMIPQAMPFNEMGQKIYSRLQNAVAAKLRVETGAQANPSEVENILARFGITSASDPKAAFDALQRLENFMDETVNITDPAGRFNKQQGQNFTFNSEAEAESANLPPGTIITINGRKARID